MDHDKGTAWQWKSTWRRISACVLAADMKRDVSFRAFEKADVDLTFSEQKAVHARLKVRVLSEWSGVRTMEQFP